MADCGCNNETKFCGLPLGRVLTAEELQIYLNNLLCEIDQKMHNIELIVSNPNDDEKTGIIADITNIRCTIMQIQNELQSQGVTVRCLNENVNNLKLDMIKVKEKIKVFYDEIARLDGVDAGFTAKFDEIEKTMQEMTETLKTVEENATKALQKATEAAEQVGSAVEQIPELTERVIALEEKNQVNENNISNLAGRVTNDESVLYPLPDRITTNEANIANLSTRMATAESNITSLQETSITTKAQLDDMKVDVAGALEDVANMETDVSTNKGKISSLETNVAKNATDIGVINARIDGLETGAGGSEVTAEEFNELKQYAENTQNLLDTRFDPTITALNTETGDLRTCVGPQLLLEQTLNAEGSIEDGYSSMLEMLYMMREEITKKIGPYNYTGISPDKITELTEASYNIPFPETVSVAGKITCRVYVFGSDNSSGAASVNSVAFTGIKVGDYNIGYIGATITLANNLIGKGVPVLSEAIRVWMTVDNPRIPIVYGEKEYNFYCSSLPVNSAIKTRKYSWASGNGLNKYEYIVAVLVGAYNGEPEDTTFNYSTLELSVRMPAIFMGV